MNKTLYKKLRQALRINHDPSCYDTILYWTDSVELADKVHDCEWQEIDYLAIKAKRINSGGVLTVLNRANNTKIIVVR